MSLHSPSLHQIDSIDIGNAKECNVDINSFLMFKNHLLQFTIDELKEKCLVKDIVVHDDNDKYAIVVLLIKHGRDQLDNNKSQSTEVMIKELKAYWKGIYSEDIWNDMSKIQLFEAFNFVLHEKGWYK